MSASPLKLDRLASCFIRGFVQLEQAIRPVAVGNFGPVTMARWPESGRRGETYTEEFFAVEADPRAIITAVHTANPGPNHFVSDIHSYRGPMRDEFKEVGYHYGGSEPFMVLDLTQLMLTESAHSVVDVTDLALAECLVAAQIRDSASVRPTTRAHLDDASFLLKTIIIDNEPVAGGKGVLIDDMLYVSDISTLPSHRHKGLAAAIMTALQESAREKGARFAVLSATDMAANLYRKLGYEQKATLDYYHPSESHPQ
jgi:ribosomal protein S18 acetylase RimI-like enzyme